jgi:hypothetical protein
MPFFGFQQSLRAPRLSFIDTCELWRGRARKTASSMPAPAKEAIG